MKTVVVFSGAGLSQESGIPTFRDSNGLWHNHKVEDVASQDGWHRNKQLVLDFYKQRFENIKACEPNSAHKALARLQEKYHVVNITMNIDDLLERAGCTDVLHLHGAINQKKCEWHKNITTLDGDTNFTCDYLTTQDKPIDFEERCPKCNGNLRPNVVWFGEAVSEMNYKHLAELVREVKYNEGTFICVGTSGLVYPASYLISFFAQVDNKYIIDPKPQKIADYNLLKGNAGEQLPLLVDALLDNRQIPQEKPVSKKDDEMKEFLKTVEKLGENLGKKMN